jgi:hypothetical protein
MSSNRISLLALLAAASVGCAGAGAHSAAFFDLSAGAAPADVIGSLRASVQERFNSAVGNLPEGVRIDDVRWQMAQFFNFPNFSNAFCFRGNWRNC